MRLIANSACGRWVTLTAFAVLGLAVGLAAVRPQSYTSAAVVLLPMGGPRLGWINAEVLVPTSESVLAIASKSLGLHGGVTSLRPRVRVRAVTASAVEITAQGKSPAEARRTDNAVATAFAHYARSSSTRPGRVEVIFSRGDSGIAHPSDLPARAEAGGIGIAAGSLVACVILIFGTGRQPRRLAM